MPYQPLRCPTCGSTKIIASENKRFFCVSCEGWFVWKDELDAKQHEAVSTSASVETVPAPPKAQAVLPTTAASYADARKPQVSGSQSAEVVTDWQTPAGYVAISIGVLAFISSWLANGREATPFDGFLNPLFYIGVFLGWYWLSEGKQIGGKAEDHPPSAFGLERQNELIMLRQREQEEALRKQKERERQDAERRQREAHEALILQKERERREAETRQRKQLQNAPPNIADDEFGTAVIVCLFVVFGAFILIIALASSSGHQNRTDSTETAEDRTIQGKETAEDRTIQGKETTQSFPKRLVGRWHVRMILSDKDLSEFAEAVAEQSPETESQAEMDSLKRNIALDFRESIFATIAPDGSFRTDGLTGSRTMKWVCIERDGDTFKMKEVSDPDREWDFQIEFNGPDYFEIRNLSGIQNDRVSKVEYLRIPSQSTDSAEKQHLRNNPNSVEERSQGEATKKQGELHAQEDVRKQEQESKVEPKSGNLVRYKWILGKVLNANSQFIEISLGRRNGLSLDDELQVFRAYASDTHEVLLGSVKVVRVESDRSVGKISDRANYASMRKGDDVLFRVRR